MSAPQADLVHSTPIAAPGAASVPAPAPGAAAPVSPGSPVTPAGSSTGWRSQLPPDLRDSETIARFGNDPGGLGKLVAEHVSLQSLIGRKGVPMPKEGDEKDLRRFYSDLGCPASADKYDLKGFEIPEAIRDSWNADSQTEMLSIFHAAGLTNEQAKVVLAGYAAQTAKSFEGVGQAKRERQELIERDLRGEWGRAFDERLERATKVAVQLFGQEFLDRSDENGLPIALDPGFIRAMAKVGDDLSETPLLGARGARTVLAPAEAEAEIRRLGADKEFRAVLLDKQHPEHDAAVKRWNAVHEAKNAGAA